MRPLHRLRMVVASLLLGLAAPALQGADVPDDVPQDCHPVYGRALTLLREFDAGLSPKDRSLARRVVDQGASQGRAAPQAYEYLGAAAALRGNYAIALWASLNAGRQAWRSATVTNIGVYLFYLGRLDEAERFLNCARKMNPRSPYALEALAMIALKRKNYPSAMSLIEQAVQLKPKDSNVLYTAGIIHFKGGQQAKGRSYLWKARDRRPGDKTFEEAAKAADPSGQGKPRPPRDELAKLVEETFAYFDHTLRRGEALAQYATAMNKLMRADAYPAVTADALRDAVAQAKVSIADHERRVREAVSSQVPARNVPLTWNMTVHECISRYLDVFTDFHEIARDAQQREHLLARAMDRPPERLFPDLLIHPGPGSTYYRMMRQERLHGYDAASVRADAAAAQVFIPCAKLQKPDEDCAQLASAQWCPIMKPVTLKLRSVADANIRAAANGFTGAVRLEYLYTRTQVSNAADYVQHARSLLRPIPEKYMAEAGAASPQSLSGLARKAFDAYVGGFVQMQIGLIENSYSELEIIETLRADVERAGVLVEQRCGDKASEIEQPVIDKEVEAIIAALKESSKVEGSPTFECVISVSDFVSIEIGLPDEGLLPRVEIDFAAGGDFTVNVEAQGSDRRGVQFSAGDAESFQGVAVDVSTTVWAEYGGGRPAEYGAEIEGRIGVGNTKMDNGVACYVLKANAQVDGRAFAESYTRAMRN